MKLITRKLESKSGPFAASCACPVDGCKFYVSLRYTDADAPRRGFALNMHIRGRVAKHIRAEHPDYTNETS